MLRDLTGAPAGEVGAERARVATEGAGARLLALQAPDGRWGGAAWNRGWDSTMHVLSLLREMGLDPASDEARRAVGLVSARVTWQGCGPQETDDNPFFVGEVEPCINGQVGAVGAYFGQDVRGIVDRLLAEQLPDGGWNCEAANGSARSSFNTTICVLEALLEYERAVRASPEVTGARIRGQEYLLERRLFRRRSTGEVIERDRKGDAVWTRFAFPTWWHYDVLRGFDYLRRASVAPDERVAEAIDLVVSKRDDDGRWPLETQYPGKMPVETDEGEGRPSRWNTLRALRVLDWYSARDERPTRVFRCHRVLRHTPQRVFEAFAKPELLARWWGPDGFTNTFEVFEFIVGGRWKLVMHGPNGSHHPNESVFLELKVPSAVVIHHVSTPRYVLRVTLATCAGGTAIEWAQEFEDGAVADRIRHIAEPANEQNLNRLQAVLAGEES